MDDRVSVLKEKMERLLREAAEVSVELDRGDGTICGVPHYSVIEARAHELGQQLSREIQQRQMAETWSYKRAAIVMKEVGGQAVSAKTIERLVHDMGAELAERRDVPVRCDDALAASPADPPELAVVECDGGRIRTREPGHGPGVHPTGPGWRETKNACLIRSHRQTFADDPQPTPPECSCDPKHVANIAGSPRTRRCYPWPRPPRRKRLSTRGTTAKNRP